MNSSTEKKLVILVKFLFDATMYCMYVAFPKKDLRNGVIDLRTSLGFLLLGVARSQSRPLDICDMYRDGVVSSEYFLSLSFISNPGI